MVNEGFEPMGIKKMITGDIGRGVGRILKREKKGGGSSFKVKLKN